MVIASKQGIEENQMVQGQNYARQLDGTYDIEYDDGDVGTPCVRKSLCAQAWRFIKKVDIKIRYRI